MPPEQQAQRLRSHHTAWIPVIAVHEAYPGHHAQALIVNENPNLLRRVISEPIFSEGWGLFTEELMFELGFLQGDDVRLTQLRNRLWRAARVILDVSLHTGRMDFDEAVAFLVEKVRFEPYAAELEVGMYVERPTYVLGYLIGMQEIGSIRAEYIALHGEPDLPSEFYDRLLRIGSIPPALLREELLGPKLPVSVTAWNVQLRRQHGTLIVFVEFAVGKADFLVRNVFVRDLVQQVVDAVQAGAFLVVGRDDEPGRFRKVGAPERLFLGLGVFFPAHP